MVVQLIMSREEMNRSSKVVKIPEQKISYMLISTEKRNKNSHTCIISVSEMHMKFRK